MCRYGLRHGIGLATPVDNTQMYSVGDSRTHEDPGSPTTRLGAFCFAKPSHKLILVKTRVRSLSELTGNAVSDGRRMRRKPLSTVARKRPHSRQNKLIRPRPISS